MSTEEQVVIRECNFSDVYTLVRPGRKERVTFDDNDKCTWVGAFRNGTPVGCLCVVVGKGKRNARIKSCFVVKEERGNGIFSRLFEAGFKHCLMQRVKKINAFATPMSRPMFLKYGFVIKTWKGDIAFLQREL